MTEEEYNLWNTIYVEVIKNKGSSGDAREMAGSAVRHYREDVKPPAMSDAELKRQML